MTDVLKNFKDAKQKEKAYLQIREKNLEESNVFCLGFFKWVTSPHEFLRDYKKGQHKQGNTKTFYNID